MTADSMEQQRVAYIRDYAAAASQLETTNSAELAPEIQMVQTFGRLCALQDIDIKNVQPFDREDIAHEARGFVGILHNIGYQAVHEGVPQATGKLKFGADQLRAKLRDHYNSPDLNETDSIRAERQVKKEREYIRLARIHETYFPEVVLAHKLTLGLVHQNLHDAAWGVRDLVIAMGMAIDDILKRQKNASLERKI